MTRRIIAAVPVVGSVGRYQTQDRRYRIESICGQCQPEEGTSLQLIITSGGSYLSGGTLLGTYGTEKSTAPFGANTCTFTLAPGAQLFESSLNTTGNDTLNGPIPHELWIETGWELALSYTHNTIMPTHQQPFQLVLTLQ